jgi:hypothetical protein
MDAIWLAILKAHLHFVQGELKILLQYINEIFTFALYNKTKIQFYNMHVLYKFMII